MNALSHAHVALVACLSTILLFSDFIFLSGIKLSIVTAVRRCLSITNKTQFSEIWPGVFIRLTSALILSACFSLSYALSFLVFCVTGQAAFVVQTPVTKISTWLICFTLAKQINRFTAQALRGRTQCQRLFCQHNIWIISQCLSYYRDHNKLI